MPASALAAGARRLQRAPVAARCRRPSREVACSARFLDYCLTAQSDLSATALDAFVVREIAAQLDGTVAQAEALDGWHRYRAYLDALAKLRDAGAVDKSDSARCSSRSTSVHRLHIARSVTGASRFSARSSGGSATTSRGWKITQDRTLTDAQKTERLAALEQQMPADERARSSASISSAPRSTRSRNCRRAGDARCDARN